ncbi:MAG: cyclic nucleotide-binding domain-containing protein [Chloroflexi bacterium]|nr:cyclic nucleotide-binding domain-containing protein [Chloroflexota bacterium]
MDTIRLLRRVEMFAGLSSKQLEELAKVFVQRTFTRDEKLFSQGDEADGLYLIGDGFVEVVITNEHFPDGHIVINLGPGQVVGEMALIDQGARSATVQVATEAAEVAYMDQAAFEALCETNTDIGYHVMRNMAADISFRLRRANA